MFYKKYIDITNDKQMFNFLKNHFTYWTINSWNRLESIANNVKLYNIGLSGDWCVALSLLEADEYETINYLIHEWERANPGYYVEFNGRNCGYLVLTHNGRTTHILPDEITESVDYEEYKRYCREYYGSVKANRSELIKYTKVVQSFDRLCDDLRDFCDKLSNMCFEVVEMQLAVEEFNDSYASDLEFLEFQYLRCDDHGIVDISEISAMKSLVEAFMRVASRQKEGYDLEVLAEGKIRLKKM